LALLCGSSGFATAEEASGRPDTQGQLRKLHPLIDADANGKLSLDEIMHFYRNTRKTSAAKEAPGIIKEFDGNKDGKVSLDELWKNMYGEPDKDDIGDSDDIARREKYFAWEQDKFKVADADSSGFLDETEFLHFFHPDLHDDMGLVVAKQTMEERDEDKDGLLTLDEFWAGRGAHGTDEDMFHKTDKDGSGKVDMNELLSWESGEVQVVKEMEGFMKLADTDGDQHVTSAELLATDGADENTAHLHFMEMIQHHEL